MPRWLRRWTNSDPQLREFERELISLECKLIEQASHHIANEIQPSSTTLCETTAYDVPATLRRSDSILRSQLAFALLAAGISIVIFAIRWKPAQPTAEQGNSTTEISRNLDEQNQKKEATNREHLVQSTLNATKRLASRIGHKTDDAASRLAFFNQSMLDEGEQVRSAGLDGLKFVAQKLPAATIRMLGLNADHKSKKPGSLAHSAGCE